MAKPVKYSKSTGRWGGSDCQQTLQQLEGILQRLNGQPVGMRPVQPTHVYLSNKFGVSSVTMRKRLQDAVAKAARSDDAALYVELWHRISDLLAGKVMTTISTIATDPSHNKAFDAAKWTLERIANESFKIDMEMAKQNRGLSVADVDQEVWDDLTPEEELQIVEIETNIDAYVRQLERIVRKVQKRLADRRVSEDNEDE